MTQSPSFTGLSPYLYYPDGDEAAAWLSRVLGFGPAQCLRDGQGRWSEGQVAVGSSRVGISSAPAARGIGTGSLLIIGVDDVDAQYQHMRAAGAELGPPRDEAYGPRTCHLTDPWGYQWYFWQGLAVFPPDQ